MQLQDIEKSAQLAEQKMLQKIIEAKNGFQRKTHRQMAFGRVLRDYYERLRNSDTSTQEYIARSLTALHYVLNWPELVDSQLLIGFVSEIINFVGDVGLGFEFTDVFVDRIM